MATIPDALTWPTNMERERSMSWMPQFGNESSPPTLDGTVQVRNGNGGGLWTASFNGMVVNTRARALVWQQLEVRMMGGLEPVDVPFMAYTQKPYTSLGSIVIRTVGAVAARATAMTINLVQSGDVNPGMHFSRYHATYGHRMYRIATVAGVSGMAGQRAITIWPPLRAAIGAAALLEFDKPLCVMKVATPDSMRLELDLRKRGTPSVSFVEAF